MPPALDIPKSTDRTRLDAALTRLRDGAGRWARRPLAARIALARAMLAGAARIGERAVVEACQAKGLDPATPPAGDEWLASPYPTLRFLRQTVRSLVMLERNGNTPVGPTGETVDGRLTVRVFPANPLDHLLFLGIRGEVHFQEGVDEDRMNASRARFHKAPDHDGRVCLVLGAGNVNAIPAGFLSVAYGGAEEGAYLASHPAVDEVHITGSNRTHDLMVWGPPGPERAERMARGAPLLEKPVSSELGNVTPVVVVPGGWSDRELDYQADSVAGMVTHNASFNCIAGKMLVLPRGWKERDRFLDLVQGKLALTPARRAWYPGAEERYRALTEGRSELRRLGGGEGTLPWTLMTGLDPDDLADPAFSTEPFCSILSETQVGSADPVEFLEAAVRFCNERLWGTLSAAPGLSGPAQRDRATAAAIERAIRALRYGSVCVNLWPGLAYSSGTGPWGSYPGMPLNDVQSGRGFVHNTRMLEHVEKLVLRGPAYSPVKLPYFPSHRSAHLLGARLASLEEDGHWRKVPGVAAAALRA